MSTSAENDSSDVIEWFPGAILQEGRPGPNGAIIRDEFALVVLNQPLETQLGLLYTLWDNASIRVAADGGANRLYDVAGKFKDKSFDNLQTIIGDLDSLTTETRNYYSSSTVPRPQIMRDPDQESTDFGKAVHHIRSRTRQPHDPPIDIVVIGGLGGRVDQGLSVLHHLHLFQSHPRYADGRMFLFSGESLTFLLKRGRHRIHVHNDKSRPSVFGKYVGILPVGRPSLITTRGLEWDVTDWETQFGGRMSTSNHVLPETAVVEVETTEDVVFTISLRDSVVP